tara:strand:- start:2927 stop:3667 length:741 start_codon:yes stop_codon:yes gene_type:complete
MHSLSEIWRAGAEATQLAFSAGSLLNTPKGDGHAVMTLPGYAGADGCMAPLRYFLKSRNYQAHGWSLGRNIPPTRITSLEEMNDFQAGILLRLSQNISEICDKTAQKVSLVGWSLGGNYANLLAQSHPDLIRQVITLGTPYGDPRGTAAWNVLKRLNRGTQADESQSTDTWSMTNNGKRTVPTTVIYSPVDGIVSPQIAKLTAENTYNIAINSSHIGFAVNRDAYRIIAEILARPQGGNASVTSKN